VVVVVGRVVEVVVVVVVVVVVAFGVRADGVEGRALVLFRHTTIPAATKMMRRAGAAKRSIKRRRWVDLFDRRAEVSRARDVVGVGSEPEPPMVTLVMVRRGADGSNLGLIAERSKRRRLLEGML
jgi:hypothetical protein